MSRDQSHTAAPAPALRTEYLLVGLFVLLIIGAMIYVTSQRQQALRSSPTGLDGLQLWLTAEGASAQNFTGGWPMDQTTVGLLVVPLYDTDLVRDRATPATKEELLFQQDEYDLVTEAIHSKQRKVPTLVVLPKWRSGLRLTGFGHPILLAERARIQATLNRVTGRKSLTLGYGRAPFTEFDYTAADGTELSAKIYAAQMMTGEGCEPLLGREGAMLLARCPLFGEGDAGDVMILTDPDLINNHGLRLGDNARIVSDLARQAAGDKNVVIDYSRSNWLTDPRSARKRERSWSDLLRFFQPPFTILWLGAAIALTLAFWRAAVRFGPVRDVLNAMGAAKSQSVGARARLMRLSNQDGALVSEYAAARIAATAAQLFGPAHARHYASAEAFLRYTKRKHPEQAAPLAEILNRLQSLSPRASAAQAMAHVDDLERVLERIRHDT
ncbi:hypothetical protein AIOL_000268 [Candidatus Rhodobacter oscarellae]|uniref:DUF4350 domain-containing protein n=1 Tax=Candidatus Rhodobacter oscarellae TaxID=1675527 RepID=A0A0J9EBX6_9RHOB|nr:hypothetical protein [Candidatus Rhodobacter lobularis]KMW60116.1 hypothetical protein AIOL_000268 [Candidatus Rhodobacter lobularis]